MKRALLFAAVSLHAGSAYAGEVTSAPYPGILLRQFDEQGQRWHALALRSGKVEMHVSRESFRGKSVSEIASLEGADIAINGAIFYASNYGLCGVGLSRGIPWTRVDSSKCAHAFGFGADGTGFSFFSGLGLKKGPFPTGVTEVSGGYPYLVRDGKACDGSESSSCAFPSSAPSSFQGPNPRTIVGVSQDRSQIYLVVVEGRRPPAALGMTLVEAARLMQTTLGVHDAVNLDGGGSSVLYVRSMGGVVNRVSDGEERQVANAILATVPKNLDANEGSLPRIAISSGSGEASQGDADSSEPLPANSGKPERSNSGPEAGCGPVVEGAGSAAIFGAIVAWIVTHRSPRGRRRRRPTPGS